MNMKKILALVLAMAMCLALVACGGAASSTAPAAPAASGETAPAAPAATDLKVGFVTSASGQNDNGYIRSACDAIKAAAEE